jgi:putative ABC transport system ATP-binding protein
MRERARTRNREIGFIFQNFNLIGDLTVFDNVELPLTYRGMPSAERRKRVQEALERVGMAHRAKHYPSQLSGGQQQRVAVGASRRRRAVDSARGRADRQPRFEKRRSRDGAAARAHRAGATLCMVTHDPRYAATPIARFICSTARSSTRARRRS